MASNMEADTSDGSALVLEETASTGALDVMDGPMLSEQQEDTPLEVPKEPTIKLETEPKAVIPGASSTKGTNPPENLSGLPGLLIYNEFCMEMSLSTDVRKVPILQLADTLQKFFFYVRVKPGAVLEQLFDQVCLVVETYRRFRVRKDPRFKKVMRVYRARLEALEGGDGATCSSPQITERLSMFCLRKLLFCAQLRPNHPAGLFNLALLYMIIYMCKGTTHWTEMKALLTSMRKSSFVCRTDVSKNLKYITFRREPGCSAGRIYEVPGHSICPFKILRLFMSKLSASSNYLWQRPKDHVRPGETWFYPDASNTITTEWLLELTEWASMTVSYTNMSLVLTPTSVLDATLADPVFAQTIADEVKDIPEPPKYDASRLETVLPGGHDKLEIKLLSSSEAQVEIRLTAIMWKELFPEWDRIRLESGYQNHVDFMHHLLEVHRSCRAESCRSFESDRVGEGEPSAHPPDEKSVNIQPINVEQRGIHNSSVLTVVNNNTIPQGVPGAQNVIVPLNDLLKTLGANAVPGGPTPFEVASSPGGLMNSVLALNALQQNGTPQTQLDPSQQLAQNASFLGQLGGPSVVQPSLTQSNPAANPLGTSGGQVIQPTSISALLGGKVPASQGATAFTQGFQSVLPNMQPEQGLSAVQSLVQAANILSTASQTGGPISTPSVGTQQAPHHVPSSSLSAGNPGLPTPLVPLQGIPPGLLNTIASQGIFTQAAGMSTPGGLPDVPVPSPVTQVAGSNSITSSLMATQLNALTGGTSPGSTFVVTDQGIVALPSLQQQQASQAGVPSSSSLRTNVKEESSAVSSSCSPRISAGLSQEQVTDPSSQQTLSADPLAQSAVVKEQFVTTDTWESSKPLNQNIPTDEEVPLDLSVSKGGDDKEAGTKTSSNPFPVVQGASAIQGMVQPVAIRGATPRRIRPAEVSPIRSMPVRSPPPPYPGMPSRHSAGLPVLLKPRDEPFKDLSEYLRLSRCLKRKGTTGKSVRELLDRKRRSQPTGSPGGGAAVDSRKSIFLEKKIRDVKIERIIQAAAASPSTERQTIWKLPTQQTFVGQPSMEQFPASSVGLSEAPRPSPEKSTGRKSRRKPQQVFKRQLYRPEDESEH